jgi:magnesium chelatase family protein
VTSLPAEVLLKEREEEPSEAIRQRVEAARKIQQERFEGTGVYFNGHMTTGQIKKYCVLNDECLQLIKTALDKTQMSARAYDKIRKVARIIADLGGSENIRPQRRSHPVPQS